MEHRQDGAPEEVHMPDEAAVADVRRHIDDYNGRRMKTFRQAAILVAACIAIAAVLVGALLYWTRGGALVGIALIAIFASAYWGVKTAWKPVQDLQNNLRGQVIPLMFGFVDRVSYSHGWDPGILGVVERLRLSHFTRAENDDAITGVHEGLQFKLLETRLSRKSGKKHIVIFRGLVFHFVIERDYPGTLVAARRNAGSWISEIIEHFFPDQDSTVLLRDDYLDRTYVVRTDNPEAAEQMVSVSLAPALGYLGAEFGTDDVRLALQQRECVLMLPTNRNYFAVPPVWQPLHYEAHVRPMIHEMVMLLAIAQLIRKL